MNPYDPYWTEQVVVDRDAGFLEMRGWAAGAAGTASFALPGVEVEVDVADAGRLVAARVEDAVAARDAVASLVGIDRVDDVLAGRAAPGEPRTSLRRRRASTADHPMTRLALLRLDLLEHGLADAVRGALLVEAAVLGDDGSAAAAAADLLGDVDVDPPDRQTTDDLARACRAAATLVDDRRAVVLRAVAARLDRWTPVVAMERAAPLMAPAPAAVAAGARAKLAPVPDVVPEVDTGALAHRPPVSARWRGPAELEISVDAPSAWARVTRRDGTPLAVVPVLDGRARVLVRPAADLFVDVTHRPDLDPPSPARRATEAALAAGVEACRADRLGRGWRAVPAWRSCADGWAAAADADRAAEAGAFAAGTRTTTQPPPSIADRLR